MERVSAAVKQRGAVVPLGDAGQRMARQAPSRWTCRLDRWHVSSVRLRFRTFWPKV